MRLIIGGYAQGKQMYAMRKYGLHEEDTWDALYMPPESWNGEKLILHCEQLVAWWLKRERDPVAEIRNILPKWKDTVVITQEVGCGLVPVTAEQRLWREAVGRMNAILAENADSVERICCGLGMYLKGGELRKE